MKAGADARAARNQTLIPRRAPPGIAPVILVFFFLLLFFIRAIRCLLIEACELKAKASERRLKRRLDCSRRRFPPANADGGAGRRSAEKSLATPTSKALFFSFFLLFILNRSEREIARSSYQIVRNERVAAQADLLTSAASTS